MIIENKNNLNGFFMNGSNLSSDNISFADADFATLVKDVLTSLLETAHSLSLDMSVVFGAGFVLIGGLLMLLFASHNAGGEDSPLFDSITERANQASKKAKSEAEEREKEEALEKEKQNERLEKEREQQEQKNKEDEQAKKLEFKQKEEERAKEKEKEKESESEREKEGLSKTGEASLMGKKNTAERLLEANAIFQKIVEALMIGKKDNDINHLFDELAKTGKDNEFSGVIEATKLFLKENSPKEKQNLTLKSFANWFEKEAEIVERTAQHMKDGPKKLEALEKASDFYMNAGEFQLIQNSTKAILNFEKAINLDEFKNEKLARCGEAYIVFERFEKAEEIIGKLLQNMNENLSRKNVSACLVYCDKMFEANLEKPALKMKHQIKETLKEKGILIPSQNHHNHQRIMSLIKEHQQEKETKEA